MRRIALFLTTLFLLSITLGLSQTGETRPQGYIRIQGYAYTDVIFGLPLWRSIAFSGAVSQVDVENNELAFWGASWTPDEFSPGDDSYYIIIASGALEGVSYEVVSNTESAITISVAPDDTSPEAIQAGDEVHVIPHWTLGSLFPRGTGIANSPNPFSPESTVKLYDSAGSGPNQAPSKTYFYHDGSFHPDAPEGWYDNDNLGGGLQDHVILPSASFLLIRHGGNPQDLYVVGTVPTCEIGMKAGDTSLAITDDVRLINPYPVPISLTNSHLNESGAVRSSPIAFDPVDLLIVWVGDPPAGINRAPNRFYFHYNGPFGPTGWYNNDDLGDGTQDHTFEGGAPILARKRPPMNAVWWIPPIPYTP